MPLPGPERPLRRVSLIYPPYGATKNEPGIKVVKENYGVFPSLSLAYVAAVMERWGASIQYIDANALELSLEETIARAEKFKPDLLAFSITTYLFHQTLAWVRAVREALMVPTLLGGVHMGLYPKETFSHSEIDLGVIGEAEITVPELFDALNQGRDLTAVRGLIFRKSGDLAITEPRPLMENVDDAPFPARHHLPNERYYSFISQFKYFTPFITSRGCPYQCAFCEQGSRKFRPRSPENVIEEIEQCHYVFKVREFDFFDSAFTVDKARVHKICDLIASRPFKAVWAIRSRVDLVDEPMLKALRRAGCKRIYYGIESSDPSILDALNKKTDLNQIRHTISATRKVGIDTFGYFMVGSPGETEQTVLNSVAFAKELKLDFAQFSKVTPMPGTALYQKVVEEKGVDYWQKIVLDSSADDYISRPGTSLTEADVQRLTRLAYIRFYFRLRYIIRALLRIKSWAELARSVRTGLSMLITRDRQFERTWTSKVQY